MVHWCCLLQEMMDCDITILQACKSIVMTFDLDASARTGFNLAIGVIVMDYWNDWREKSIVIQSISKLSKKSTERLQKCGKKWLSDNNIVTIISPDCLHVKRVFVGLSKRLKMVYREDWYKSVMDIFWSETFEIGMEKTRDLYNKYSTIKDVNRKIGIIFQPHFMRRIFPWCNRRTADSSYLICNVYMFDIAIDIQIYSFSIF